MPRQELHIAVVGGGIAGLATAHALLARHAGRVQLFEAQGELGFHSSGRSAGIWLPTEEIDESPRWTKKSVELLDQLFEGRSWLRQTGAYKIAPQRELLEPHFEAARASGCTPRWIEAAQLDKELSFVPASSRKSGFYVPEAGVLDTGAMLTRLAEQSSQRGLEIHLGTPVVALTAGSGRRWSLRGLETSLGEFDWVVDASGAWGSRLFAPLGFDRSILPLRRHILRYDQGLSGMACPHIVWAEGPEFYLRPGKGEQCWACPCDEELVEPGCIEVDQGAGTGLEARLGQGMSLPTQIWSGTRNHSEDGCILKGPVPGASGLAWLLGLAGRGMTVGLGVADAGAQAILDAADAPSSLN